MILMVAATVFMEAVHFSFGRVGRGLSLHQLRDEARPIALDENADYISQSIYIIQDMK